MSFLTLEKSEQSGKPVELFMFNIGSDYFTYTNADEDITFNALTYKSVEIKRSKVALSNELGKNTITVTVKHDHPIAVKFIGVAPAKTCWLTIFRLHRGDTDYRSIWQGRVSLGDFKGSRVDLNGTPLDTFKKRMGLWETYQAGCQNILYDDFCRLDKNLYRVSASVSFVSADGLTIQATAFHNADPTYFVPGYVERQDTGEMRDITAQDNATNSLTLMQPFEDLRIGTLVWAYAGCAHDMATCSGGKFTDPDTGAPTNEANYNGCDKVPTRNVFQDGLS